MLASICIATYNGEHSIRRLLDSIQKQTVSDFEVIIVDDHSTDDTVNIVFNEFCAKDKRFKLFVNCTEKKYQDAHNLSYEYATGDILFRLDDDDILMPDYIEYHLNFFAEHPDIDAFSTKMIRKKYQDGLLVDIPINEDVLWNNSQSEEERQFFNEHPEISWCGNTMIWSNPSSSLRKSFYDKYHPKFISYSFGDYVFWWDVIASGAKLYKSEVEKSYHCDYSSIAKALSSSDDFYFLPWTLLVEICNLKIKAFERTGNIGGIEKFTAEKEMYIKKINGEYE